jgi:hypothetical protein
MIPFIFGASFLLILYQQYQISRLNNRAYLQAKSLILQERYHNGILHARIVAAVTKNPDLIQTLAPPLPEDNGDAKRPYLDDTTEQEIARLRAVS